MKLGYLFESMEFKKQENPKAVRPPKNLVDRRDLVKQFVDRLHADTEKGNEEEKIKAHAMGRKPKLWPKVSARLVAVKMAHLNISELEAFLGRCKEAKHFSKCWWWSLNPNSVSNDGSN